MSAQNTIHSQTLGEYIKEKLGDRSIRALATYADVSVSTVSRITNDKIDNPDAATLIKIAEYLKVPVEELYRLAGYLEDDDEEKDQLIREIEYFLKKLPPESQRRILEIIRVEHRLQTQGQGESDSDEEIA